MPHPHAHGDTHYSNEITIQVFRVEPGLIDCSSEYATEGEKEYLPFIRQTGYSGGAIDAPEDAVNWSFYGEDAPYAFSKVQYDNSPLDRPLKATGAGRSWHENDKAVVVEYMSNSRTAVTLWTIGEEGLTNSGKYPAGVLVQTNTQDEDGCQVREFRDNEDRVILTQSFDTGAWRNTYYVYDEYGLLRYVLPPEACAQGIDEQRIADYCYVYKYDIRRRLIEKKLPGNEPVYYVYDARERPALSQDGNQRAAGKWSYTRYNSANKPIEVGEAPLAATRETLAEQVGAVADYVPADRYALQYTYYNCYDFEGVHPCDASYNISGGAADEFVPGAVTGTRTRVLGTDTFLNSTTYYDTYGRTILTITDSWPDTACKSYYASRYDFTGNLLEARETHQTAPSAFDTLTNTSVYDDRGRLLLDKSDLNGAEARSEYSYNPLGRLESKSHNGNSTETFTYNIRGWLTRKESPCFSMQLHYEAPPGNTALPRFNGNISQWDWMQADGIKKSYSFEYDPLNRLLGGAYMRQEGTGWIQDNAFSEYGLSYDANGNILSLKRNAQGEVSDDMTYRYTGNRLMGLNNMGTEIAYGYDSNGNMTSDGLKNLQIAYNCLNLVQQVSNSSGAELATYRWQADGSKLQVSAPDGSGYIYRGSLIYNAQGLESAGFNKGRILKTSDGYQLRYHITDHLGSVRTIVDGLEQIVEQSDYYPFGARHADPRHMLADNRYHFNGKEVQSTAGLDFLDYGARMYDPHVGRWSTPDPMAHLYYASSSYAYVRNNPAGRIDPNGLWDEAPRENSPKPAVQIEPVTITAKAPKKEPWLVVFNSFGWDLMTPGLSFARSADQALADKAYGLWAAYIFAGVVDMVTLSAGTAVKGATKATVKLTPTIRKFTQGNFRSNLAKLTGVSPAGKQAHHVLPQKFNESFEKAGIIIHDPRYGVWLENKHHLGGAYKYNKGWEKYFIENPTPTQEAILHKADELMETIYKTTK